MCVWMLYRVFHSSLKEIRNYDPKVNSERLEPVIYYFNNFPNRLHTLSKRVDADYSETCERLFEIFQLI